VGPAEKKAGTTDGGVVMISEVRRVTFVWRCSGCPAVYEGESLALLLDDGTSKACSCGGRLVEGVGPAPERVWEAEAALRRPSAVTSAGTLRSV
jgi:hypothetical protein